MIKTHAALDDEEVQQHRNQGEKTTMTKSASNLVLFMVDFSKLTLCFSFCVCIFVLHTASFQPVFLISFTLLLHIVSTPKKQ